MIQAAILAYIVDFSNYIASMPPMPGRREHGPAQCDQASAG